MTEPAPATIAELEAAANEQVRRVARLPPDHEFVDPLARLDRHPPAPQSDTPDQDTAA